MKNDDNLKAYVATTGALVPAASTAGAKGCTLANATTYYFPIPAGVVGTRLANIVAKWAAAVSAVFTLETTDLPPTDVSDYDATAGNGWQQINPPSAYVPVSGAGNSASAATVTAGGANAGAATFALSNISAPRMRIKAVVTIGGLVRLAAFGKVK